LLELLALLSMLMGILACLTFTSAGNSILPGILAPHSILLGIFALSLHPAGNLALFSNQQGLLSLSFYPAGKSSPAF